MAIDRTKVNPADDLPVNDIELTEQEILNKTFDKTYNVIATEMLGLGPDGKLKRIATDLSGGINVDVDMATEGIATEATLASVKTAVETIDNAISGNEMQVDVLSTVLPTGASTSAKQDTQILVNKGLVDLDYTFTRNADGSVATIATTDGVTTNTQTFVRDGSGAITAINSVIT